MIHKKTNLRKKIWSLALCLCMIVSCLPVSAFAETDSDLCEHHHEHTAECGYVAAVEGQPCTHVHTDDCYSIAQCAHEHNESCGYSEGTLASDCTHECGEECAEGCIHEHDDACGYAEATEATPCNHVCSVEGGCYELVCSHAVEGQHDDTCGYVEAVEGSPCKYECNEDHGKEENSETSAPAYTAEEVKTMIDALPDVSELESMSEDELNAVYEDAEEAYDAFETLTDAEQIELANDLVKLRNVLDYVTEQTMPLTTRYYYYENFTIRIVEIDVQKIYNISATVNNSTLTLTFDVDYKAPTHTSTVTKTMTYTKNNYSCDEEISNGQTNTVNFNGYNVYLTVQKSAGHYVTKWTSVNSTQHSGICEICGQTVTENHTGNATCSVSDSCSKCGENYINPDNHKLLDNGICGCGKTYQEAPLSDGVYQISNLGQLRWFAEKVNNGETSISGKLMNDIDATSLGYIGIGKDADHAFAGTFDGNNKTLKIALVSTEQYVAPFRYIKGATIKNLTVSGTIKTTHKFAAGIVGRVESGNARLENCLSLVKIDSTNYTDGNKNDGTHGGLIGVADGGTTTINNCGFAGSMVGSTTRCCGGIVGWAGSTVKISNSFVAAKFELFTGESGDTFARNQGKVTVTNCYYLNALSDEMYIGATRASADQFKSGEVAYKLNNGVTDGTQAWYQTCQSDAYPKFSGKTVYMGYVCGSGNSDPVYRNSMDGLITFASPKHDWDDAGICRNCNVAKTADWDENEGVYKIYDLIQLQWFADYVNAGNTNINGKLMADIDASSVANFGIGTSSNKYAGIFDGNGYTINIKLNGSESVALFPYVNGATIKNLTVKGYITASGKYAASLVGQAEGNVTIEKCISTVEITSTVSGDGTHGGLVGVVNSGTMTINNCGFAGQINGSNTTNCGGLVGYSTGKTNISNSFVAASFTLASGNNYTFSRKPENVSLTNCYFLNAFGIANSGATQKNADQFASGEVAYLLNGKKDDGTWKQTLKTDTTPNFSGGAVYKTVPCESFTNNEAEKSKNHNFNDDGFCENCKDYQPAVWNESKSVYEISNAGQLYWFAALTNGTLKDGTAQNASANAVLMKNITVNTGVIVNGSLDSDTSAFRAWTPIGDISSGGKYYAGTFDGNGHTVSGLYAKASVNNIGFFGSVSGSIKNLTVSDSYFESSNNTVGGIVGWLEGTAEKCASVGCIVKGNQYVGGISGSCSNGTIINCYSTSILTGSKYVGGISGNAQYVSTIKNCYFNGVNNCNDYKSGITTAVISIKACQITVDNCYYDVKVNPHNGVIKQGTKGTLTQTNIVGASTERFKTGEITWLLNGSKSDGVWKQALGTDTYPNFTGLTVYKNESGYPKYTNHASCTHDYDIKGFCTKCGGYQPAVLNNGVYEISNAGQLFWFAAFVNDGNGKANAVLKADIDLENRAWTPIGQYSDADNTNNIRFEGTFDGDYHVIRNLNVKLTDTYEVGLFSRTYGATLKNFGVINASVESTQGIRSGVIGGEIHNSTVTNVFTAGNITVTTSHDQAGGIAGECAGSTLTNCFTTYGTLCVTAGSVTNGFYLADTANANSVGENKTQTQFESGELTWLLNGNSSVGVWKQTIDTDAYPNFTGKTVYYDASQNPQYYNDQIASVTITWTDMSFSYHKGTWNTDTMTWEGGGYVADDGCGTVTVTNTGNVDVNAKFDVNFTDNSLGISVSFTENDVLLEDKKLKVLAGQAKTVAVKLTGNEPSEYIETAKTIGQITVTLSTE